MKNVYLEVTMKVYFAAPLFSEADQMYNAYLAKKIRQEFPEIDLYVPQEQADINDKSKYADSTMIAKVDTDKVLESDLMIALLDGTGMDAGVAAEIGIAFAREIPILGLFTDVRTQGAEVVEKLEALKIPGESQFAYVNLYVVGLIRQRGEVYSHTEDLLKKLKEYREQ